MHALIQTTLKREVEAADTPFIRYTPNTLSFDLNDFVRQYYIEEVNP